MRVGRGVPSRPPTSWQVRGIVEGEVTLYGQQVPPTGLALHPGAGSPHSTISGPTRMKLNW